MLTEVQLFVIATVASVIVYGLKLWKKELPSGVLTTGVYAVSLILAFFFAPLALPAFPPLSDAVMFVPALLAWIGALLIPLSSFVGFATLIYNVLLKSVLDKSAAPFMARFLGKRSVGVPGLTEGRMVHFVLNCGPYKGQHRPAVIVRVWNPEGTCNLQVLTDSGPDHNSNDSLPQLLWATSARYDPTNKDVGTWHYIEAA